MSNIELSMSVVVARKVRAALATRRDDEDFAWIVSYLDEEIKGLRPKAPWRRVVRIAHVPSGNQAEVLECGHRHAQGWWHRGDHLRRVGATRRRCKECEGDLR